MRQVTGWNSFKSIGPRSYYLSKAIFPFEGFDIATAIWKLAEAKMRIRIIDEKIPNDPILIFGTDD